MGPFSFEYMSNGFNMLIIVTDFLEMKKNHNLVKLFMYLNQFSSDLEVKNSSQFLDGFGHSVARQKVGGSHSSCSPDALSDVAKLTLFHNCFWSYKLTI